MVKRGQIAAVLLLVCFQGETFSQENELPDLNAQHKLRVDITSLEKYSEGKTSAGNYAAGRGSTFFIYDTETETVTVAGNPVKKQKLVIKFNRIKKPNCTKRKKKPCAAARKNQFYLLDSSLVKNFYYKASSASHGIMVVPFKIRGDDGSLSGQSTLGYFLGYKKDRLLGSGTFFGSVGLTQVDVPIDGDSTDSRTGLTVSGGFLFQFTDGFQTAIVIGADHLGGEAGDDWEYEDDVWISIGLGFNLATKSKPQ